MGYDNDERLMGIVDDLLSKEEKTKKWQELFTFFNIDGKRSARQLQTAQGLKEVYLIGKAAGVVGREPNTQLATQEDIDASITKNAASINVLGPYSARFAKGLTIAPR